MTLKYNSTTTLNRIREGSPSSGRACSAGWETLLKTLGKTKGDDEPINLLAVLDSNGIDDALWVLSFAMPDDRLARHFQAWCAEQVLHLFEAERPNDMRVRYQIAMLRNDDATDEDRDVARDAAWDVARDAARDVARDAARAVAWAAARAVAWDAARPEARAEARAEAWARQESQLRKMIGETI